MADTTTKAVFAGGCFWCMEPEFANLAGVSKVVVGYTGGKTANPTYEQVSTGTTGHVEAVEITYDPKTITFEKLLDKFWENIDPVDPQGQFCDKGSQYLAGIFYHNDEEKRLAEQSKDHKQTMFKEPIAVIIKPASIFYPAEDYHQEYYIKEKMRYSRYRKGCGRDETLDKVWGDKLKKSK